MKKQSHSGPSIFDTKGYDLKGGGSIAQSWNAWAHRTAPFCMVIPESVHELRGRMSFCDLGGVQVVYCQVSESHSVRISASVSSLCQDPSVWLLLQSELPMVVEQGNEKCILDSGDLVLLDAELPIVRSYGAASFRVFYIPKPLMGDFQDDIRLVLGRNLKQGLDSTDLLAAYASSLNEELTSNLLMQSLSARHVISHHLVMLVKLAIQQAKNRLEGVDHNGTEHRLFKDVLLYVQENYMDPELCVEVVARQFSITPRHVHRLFRDSKHGKTFLETVHHLRLHHARQLLESRTYSHLLISEIALLCGFSDHVNFSKFFKRYFAITPGGLRKQSLTATALSQAEMRVHRFGG